MNTQPQRLGKYELQERLGQGGMAEVWKAFDPQLRRYVAIKFLHPDLRAAPDFMARFIREGQAIASLRHPNIGVCPWLEQKVGIRNIVEKGYSNHGQIPSTGQYTTS